MFTPDQYGSTVSSSDVTVRHAFIKKVYSILSVQLLFTAIVSLIMVQVRGSASYHMRC